MEYANSLIFYIYMKKANLPGYFNIAKQKLQQGNQKHIFRFSARLHTL